MQNKGTKKKPADIILMITAHQIGTNANESTALVHGFESFAYSFPRQKENQACNADIGTITSLTTVDMLPAWGSMSGCSLYRLN